MPNFLASHMDRRLAGVPLPALALPTLHRLPWIKNNHKTRFKELAIKEIQDWKNLLRAALEQNTGTEMCSIYRRLYMSKTSFSSCGLNFKKFTFLFSLKLYLLRSCLEQRLYPRPQTQEPVLDIICCTHVQCIKWEKAGCLDKPYPSRAVPVTSSSESPQNKGGKPLIQRVKHSLVCMLHSSTPVCPTSSSTPEG